MKTIELTPKQRREIQEQRRQASDRRIYQRLSTLLWIDDGRTREEVAALLGVTSRQVGDWLRIFRNKGLKELCTLHYRGDPGRLRPAQVEQLKQEIAKGVFHNAEQVRAWIEALVQTVVCRLSRHLSRKPADADLPAKVQEKNGSRLNR